MRQSIIMKLTSSPFGWIDLSRKARGLGQGSPGSSNGDWLIKKVYSGSDKEVFDAELNGIEQALEIACRAGQLLAQQTSQATRQKLFSISKVHVRLDSKSAIERIKNLRLGQVQWLARRVSEHTSILEIYMNLG